MRIYKTHHSSIGEEAFQLLDAAALGDGQIIKSVTLSSTSISVNGNSLLDTSNPREIAKWENVIAELLARQFVEVVSEDTNWVIYKASHSGYEYVDTLKQNALEDSK